MITGEPRHTSHDEGQWLQTEVSAAVARGDAEITRLAQRAAIPLIARARTPVSPLGFNPPVTIEMPAILTLPMPVAYRAHLFASVDGGELVPAGTVSSASRGGSLDWSLLESGKKAGLHHIRLRARIIYEHSTLSAETRDLPEVVYAIYDPDADARFDARFYVASAKSVSARRLDATLPDVPFATWLHDVVAPYSGEKAVEEEWRISYCDELSVEAGLPPRRRDLCTVAYFNLTGGWGEIWLRTGRIELTDSEVRWLAERPAVEGIRLRHTGLQGSERWPVGPSRSPGCRSLVLAFCRSLGRAGRHRRDTDRNDRPHSRSHPKLRERKRPRRRGDDRRGDERSRPRDQPQLRCRRAKRRNDGDRAVSAILRALRGRRRAGHANLRAHAPRQLESGSNTGRRRRLSHHQRAARAERVCRVADSTVRPNLPRILEP